MNDKKPIKSDSEVVPPSITSSDEKLDDLALNLNKVLINNSPDRPIFTVFFDHETRRTYVLHKNLHLIPNEEREITMEIIRHELFGT